RSAARGLRHHLLRQHTGLRGADHLRCGDLRTGHVLAGGGAAAGRAAGHDRRPHPRPLARRGAAHHRDPRLRHPVFFVGLLLKLVFSVGLGWLPVAGRLSTAGEISMSQILNPTPFYLLDALRLGDMELLGDVVRHAILPAVALGILTGGIFLRLVRTNMIGTLEMQYIESARSRGVAESRLTTRHGLRPALIPIITVMGMQIALMLGGAVL